MRGVPLTRQKGVLIERMNPPISVTRSQQTDVTKHFKSDGYRLAALIVDRAALVLKWAVIGAFAGSGGFWLLPHVMPGYGPAALRPAISGPKVQPEGASPPDTRTVIAAGEHEETPVPSNGDSKHGR